MLAHLGWEAAQACPLRKTQADLETLCAPVTTAEKEALLGVLLFAQSSQVWVCSGQTGYYHESQVPDYLLKLAWRTTCCSFSHQWPCLYLSEGVLPPPPLSSCPHPHVLLALGKAGGKSRGEREH